MATNDGWENIPDDEGWETLPPVRSNLARGKGWTPLTTQQDFDSLPPWQKLAIGAGQSVAELGSGLKELVGADTTQERADQAAMDAIDSGWKTGGKVLGDVAMATLPAGAMGTAARVSNLARNQRVAAMLGGEAWGAGAVEALQAPTDKLQAGALAAGTTAATAGALGRLGGTVTPDAAALLDQGVKLTPGQAYTGGVLQGLEELASYIPGLASGVRKGRDEALRSWNAALRQGQRPPQEAMKRMRETLGKEYDQLFSGKWVIDADDLGRRWMGLQTGALRELPEAEANRVFKLLGSYYVSAQ